MGVTLQENQPLSILQVNTSPKPGHEYRFSFHCLEPRKLCDVSVIKIDGEKADRRAYYLPGQDFFR